MPPRKDRDANTAKKRGPAGVGVAAKVPRIAANGHKLPDQLPSGIVLKDVKKQHWKLGKSIGVGGFGEIYLASDDIQNPVSPDAHYVVKIEPHNNGPLFAEMHFYHRVGKEEQIQAFVREHRLDYLGMPRFVASGSLEHNNVKYRFMVMDRFGEDLQKILNRSNRQFNLKTSFTLGIRILDILQYIHGTGYIHADVKASNLLLGFGKGQENKVYLIDFGLACRYLVDGVHKEYKEDLRKAHDGTIEFTSRDAHIGAHSRRGDLEILGYNMLQWLCGQLPWEENLKDPEYVKQQKLGFMANTSSLMNKCFPRLAPPEGIVSYFQYIAQLQFEEEPDYEHCRTILRNSIKKAGFKDDMELTFVSPKKASRSKSPKKRGKKQESDNLKQDSDSDIDFNSSSQKKVRKKAGQQEPFFEDPPSVKNNNQRGRKRSTSLSEQTMSRDSSYDSPKDTSMENPTPAMLQVMERRLELKRQMKLQEQNGTKKGRQKSSKGKSKARHTSPDFFPTSTKLWETKHTHRLHSKGDLYSSRQPLSTRPTQSITGGRSRSSYSPEV